MSKTETTMRLACSGAALLAGITSSAQAQDVNGFYGGLGLSLPSGSVDFSYDGRYSLNGSALGSAFAGYNAVSSGGLVYGGEIAVPQGADVDGAYGTPGINAMVDLKGRMGKVFGKTLVYGSLGYSMGSATWNDGTGTMAKVGGVNLGAGFETPLGARGFFGGDITSRNLNPTGTNDNGDLSSSYVDSMDMTTVSVRVGFRF